MDKHGLIPEIGDSDDAWVVRLDDDPKVNNFRSIVTTAATLLQDPTLKRPDTEWDEKSYWLLGEEGRASFTRLQPAALQSSPVAFTEGGYHVMRTANCLVTFDTGPLGYLSTAAHGHADALSITLSANGIPLLIDPGTYGYQEGGEWRQFLRSTAAHNTVVVDNRDQSEMQGTFLWGRKATCHLLEEYLSDDFAIIVAEHDGYRNEGIVHRRTLIYDKPDCLFVIDELNGTGSHQFEQLWHLPVDATLLPLADHTLITVAQQQAMIVPLYQDEYPLHRKVYYGQREPMQGWVSHHYGHIASAPVLSLGGESTLSTKLFTAICLVPLPLQHDQTSEKALTFGKALRDSPNKSAAIIAALENRCQELSRYRHIRTDNGLDG